MTDSTRSIGWSIWAAVAVVCCLVLLDLGHAATFSVDDTDDLPDVTPQDRQCLTAAGTCTLRAAVEQANATPALDSINLRAGIYDLTRGPLNIINSLSIRGVTEDTTVVRKGTFDPDTPSFELGLVRIGSRDPRIVVNSVSLSRVTFSGGGGFVREGFPAINTGGAIINNEGSRLSLERVKIIDNNAEQGGGIANLGSLVMRRSTIRRNTATGPGVNSNGGAGLTNGHVDLLNTIRGASALIEESTINANEANKEGGGITNFGSLTIINSTISGNKVNGDSAFAAGGAGIFNGNTLTLRSVTITQNQAPGNDGGGIFNAGTVTMINTIVAENTASSGRDCFGTIDTTSNGFNLIGNAEDCTLLPRFSFDPRVAGPRNIVNVDPGLLPLEDRGGPTQTHGLCLGPGNPPSGRVETVCLEASPALDAMVQVGFGPSARRLGNNTCTATDQRGFRRPPLTPIFIPEGLGGPARTILVPIGAHASCDIGAFDAFATAP